MADLLRIIRGILRGQVQVPEFELGETSHCGCLLAEGCWGSDGWHYYRHDAQSVYRLLKQRFADQRPGWSREALRKEFSRFLDAEEEAGRIDSQGVHETLQTYLGTAVAFEPCKPYRAKVRETMEAEVARTSSGGGKRLYEAPANASWSGRERRGSGPDGADE